MRADVSSGNGRQSGTGITLSGVGKRFGEVVALAGIDLGVPVHSRTGLVGPSGCGKSTLLHIVAGLLEPDAGEVNAAGATAAAERLAACALMLQRDLLLPWRTALDNAAIALENRGVPRKEARSRARPLFARFGLARFEDARPAQLSGGMRQRVSFMRTLAADKDVLLLDEPFGSLDSITRARMQEWLLRALAEVPRTVLLVTHDVEEALLLSKEVVVMSPRPGRVVRVLTPGFPTDAPRREIVTSPEFVALKEQALEAID
ncbi:MAG: ABC transporter ATP-binding protein [Actinobacteria bacterium]|nr:ABC transporter ATP-binding protein [Actinomycetota bacterium]